MIRVLVVDDHPIITAGVQALLDDQPDLAVVGCAPDGETAIEMARVDPPDIVVMDLSMPGMGGLEATRTLLSDCPSLRVLILTWHADPRRVRGALAAGATGYLLKDAGHEELLEAIRAVHRGESRISDVIAREMTS